MFKRAFAAFLCAAVFSYSVPDYGRVLVNMGYAAEREPAETAEIEIPREWGAVYERYNALQKQGGFDLSPYKGRRCVRYTYEIPAIFARGNVLVCDGEIIGGDICSITIDGIMLPLEKDKL